ncbi:hypothetical protein Tco_0705741 [Tanacetum coccineum]|uniref:Uncharacterized protein n=1 Tax=Tanacetum coccineum TaxID=301880 RepID=A0ABQ4Y5F9_9ASTR
MFHLISTLHNHLGRQKRGQGNYARGVVTSGNGGAQNRVGNTNPGQAKQIKCYNFNGTNTFDDDMDEAPVQDLALDVLSYRAFNRGQRLSRLINVMLLTYDVEELLTAQSMFMEELLKKELHSVKIQLNSTINHNKLIKEEVATLKKDFKQKENKYLEEFLDMKQLKEKVEDKLYKQDQSLQTIHMLCKPKPFYDEKKKVEIGYKNLLNLTKAKQVQHALYNGHELVKTTHTPAVVHDSEDTLEFAETTRMKMLEKSKSTLWVDSKIKIAPCWE